MSVCLNPQGGHPAPEGAPQRPFCKVAECGYLMEGACISKWRVSSFFAQGPTATLYLASRGGGDSSPTPRALIKVVNSPIIQPLARLEQAVNQLLALNHPHIHRLESVGMLGQSGPLYLVSSFEEQGSLARHPNLSQGLPGQAAAAIARQIADALHKAHEAGVVHGRLRLENCLLVGPSTLHITDFYQSLLAEAEPSFSPLYMAPEQAYDHLGPASDQYALGVLVFLLLTGQVPFTGPNRRAIISQHIQSDPPPLSQLRPDLPRQVEATIRRALSKRPSERFPSILAFATGLQAAVETRPGTTGSLTPLDILSPRTAAARLIQAPGSAAEPPEARIPTGALPLCLLPGHTADITVLRWAPDGGRLASAGLDEYMVLWGIRQKVGTMLARYETRQNAVRAFCWSPDSKLFATAAGNATISLWEAGEDAQAATGIQGSGKTQRAWWGHDGSVTTLDWSPDGTRIASGGADRTVRLWDKMGKRLAGWQVHGRGGVTALAWSPNNQMLASGGADRQIVVCDPTNGAILCTGEGHLDEVRALAWSPQGNMLASAAGKKDMRVLLWNPHTGQQIGQFSGHSRHIIGMFWAPDGSWLATASADRRLRFWNTRQPFGQQVCRPIEIEGSPIAMAGAPASGLVALSLDTMSLLVLQLTWR